MPGWKNPHFLSAWKKEDFDECPLLCALCLPLDFNETLFCLAWAVFFAPWQVQFAYHDSCIALCGEGTTEIVEILQREVGGSWCGTSDKLGGEKSVQAVQERNIEMMTSPFCLNIHYVIYEHCWNQGFRCCFWILLRLVWACHVYPSLMFVTVIFWMHFLSWTNIRLE